MKKTVLASAYIMTLKVVSRTTCVLFGLVTNEGLNYSVPHFVRIITLSVISDIEI